MDSSFLRGMFVATVVLGAFAGTGRLGPERAAADEAVTTDGLALAVLPGSGGGHGVAYVLDAENRRLMIYEYRAGGRLELAAVRNLEFDRMFQEFPGEGSRVQEPTVRVVRDRVSQQPDASPPPPQPR